jgi:DNA replication protein DnaC
LVRPYKKAGCEDLSGSTSYKLRYERASIIFTSNKSYGEWGDIFKDHVIAAAILDRILHHCTTVNIKGDSYRLKDRKRQGIIPQSFSG